MGALSTPIVKTVLPAVLCEGLDRKQEGPGTQQGGA